MPLVRCLTLLALLSGAIATLTALPALAQLEPRRDPQDQIVLSGRVVVLRGDVVGEVVVLRGRVTIAGVARGDVIVLDGRISVLGQVSGSVINIDGPVLLGPDAHVRGDVLARERITVREGAVVDGDIREGAAFTFRAPITALGRFAGWLAVTVSTLLLGMLLILIAPRGADAIHGAARTSPWASLGWGVAVFTGLPVIAVLTIVSLLGLPFGLILLLGLALVYFCGYAWSAWAVGRTILRPPGNRAVAFLVGWAILRAVALIPFFGIATWVAGAVFGVGAMTVAAWRARGAAGKHRERRPERVELREVVEEPKEVEAEVRTGAPEPPVGGVL